MPAGPRVALDSTTAWSAVRSAGGSLSTAARALGVTPTQLLEVLRDDPPIRLGLVPNQTSGLRRRVVDDETPNPDSEL
jgi:hypothetical protein